MNRWTKDMTIMTLILVAAALIGLAVGFLLQRGGTVSSSNPPMEDGVSVARGFTLAPGLEKAAKPDPSRCIFAEHGIGPGCRYDDRFLAKVGRDGVKAYGSAEVLGRWEEGFKEINASCVGAGCIHWEFMTDASAPPICHHKPKCKKKKSSMVTDGRRRIICPGCGEEVIWAASPFGICTAGR